MAAAPFNSWAAQRAALPPDLVEVRTMEWKRSQRRQTLVRGRGVRRAGHGPGRDRRRGGAVPDPGPHQVQTPNLVAPARADRVPDPVADAVPDPQPDPVPHAVPDPDAHADPDSDAVTDNPHPDSHRDRFRHRVPVAARGPAPAQRRRVTGGDHGPTARGCAPSRPATDGAQLTPRRVTPRRGARRTSASAKPPSPTTAATPAPGPPASTTTPAPPPSGAARGRPAQSRNVTGRGVTVALEASLCAVWEAQ